MNLTKKETIRWGAALAAAILLLAGSAQAQTATGYDSLFMGHSFLKDFANGLAIHPAQAGITGHSQTVVFTGGCGGTPLSLWNDPADSATIKAVLDTSNVELLGMAYAACAPTTEGYELWIDYALSKNPDTVFFVGPPWPGSPNNYADAAAYASAWAAIYDPQWLPFIDSLRALYPGKEIFSIPWGQVASELTTLFEAGNLPDVSSLTGDFNDAVFTDGAGHPAQIFVDTGELVWLNAIYGVDLDTYAHDPGYITDIKAIARDIMDAHNPAYNAPPPPSAPATMVDDFDGGNTDYPWTENGPWYVSGEVYHQDDVTGYRSTFAGAAAWSAYTLTADMITTGSGAGAANWMTHSLAFRVTDIQNNYRVRLDADGTLKLRSYVNGANSVIASVATSYDPFAWHTYRVIVDGDSIEVSIDGQVLIDINDSDHAAGNIGVFTSLSSVSLDNVSVVTDGVPVSVPVLPVGGLGILAMTLAAAAKRRLAVSPEGV